MLETAIHNGAEKLWLEEKVAEARAVDAGIGALDLRGAGAGDGMLASLLFILLVVEQFLLVLQSQ